jgi:hypothetical protein
MELAHIQQEAVNVLQDFDGYLVDKIDHADIIESFVRSALSDEHIRDHYRFRDAIIVQPRGVSTLSNGMIVGYLMVCPTAGSLISEGPPVVTWNPVSLSYTQALENGYCHIGTISCGIPSTLMQEVARASMVETVHGVTSPFVARTILSTLTAGGHELIVTEPCISFGDALFATNTDVHELTRLMLETLERSRHHHNSALSLEDLSVLDRRLNTNRPGAITGRGFWSKVKSSHRERFESGFPFDLLSELESEAPLTGDCIHYGDQLYHNTFFAPHVVADNDCFRLEGVTRGMYLTPGDPEISSPYSQDGFVAASIVASHVPSACDIKERNIPYIGPLSAHASGMWTKFTLDEADASNKQCSVEFMDISENALWDNLPQDFHSIGLYQMTNGTSSRLEYFRAHANGAFIMLGLTEGEPRVPYLSLSS